MYNTMGSLSRKCLCVFPETSGIKPNCAWYHAETDDWFIGTVNGRVWKALEDAWAHDTTGNWTGGPPPLIQPINLRAINADGTLASVTRPDIDYVTQIPSGENFSLIWLCQTLSESIGSFNSAGSSASIFSASDGLLVASVDSPALPWHPGPLADGSYTLHVKYNDIVEGLRVPPGAYRDPIYNYTTQDNRLSHYDPYENWGEVPMDRNHPLRLLRVQIVQDNLQRDVPEWAYYLTSEEPRDGEGAMIKLQVGGGSWEADPDVFLSPARPLHQLVSGEPLAVPSDPMMSQITYYLRMRSGRVLLGGTRMDKDGTHPAVWEWDPITTTTTPIATARVVPRPVCEQRLSTGGVTGMIERADSKVVILTLCSRHILNERPDLLPEERMPRYPLTLDGEPGGRSLVCQTNRVLHLTESFGKQPDPASVSFYDMLVDVQGDRLTYGPGVVAHVDSALWSHFGKSYGIRADKVPTSPDANMYITYNDGTWNKSPKPWRADWIFLQRGISVNGRSVCFGYVPEYEIGRAILNDGVNEQLLSFDYRVRGLFLTESDTPGYRWAVCPAREIIGTSELSNDWSVIILNGYKDDDWIPGDPLPPDLPDPGGQVPDPPTPGDGIYYRVISLEGIPTYAIHLHDVSDSYKLTTRVLEEEKTYVMARVDSDEDISNLDSYPYVVPLGRLFTLPIEAYTKVDVIVFWNSDDDPCDLPLLARRV